MTDNLDPSTLLAKLSSLLPGDKQLASSTDAVAALIHTVFTKLSFELVGVDDDDSSRTFEGNALPEGWNDSKKGCITFRYRQEGREVVVKVMKMGKQTVVNAIGTEDNAVANLTIPTEEFTSKAFYPHAVASTEAEKLAEGFVSSERVSRLVDEVMMTVVLPIVPGASRHASASSRLQAENAERRREPESGLRETPAERQVNLQDRPTPTTNPLQIGRSDLDPLPLQNQPNPLAPSNLIPPNQGDGMFVGPDHPIFGGAFGPGRGQRAPGQSPWGGDGYLPPLGAPPGARFDPVGPFGGAPFGGPGRQPFGRAPLRSGDPDFDEALPPGFDNGASSFGFGGSGRGRAPPGPMPPGAGDMFM
ncbi:hypothetical protein SCHPADRAFT_934973 [Schizopora paradoxa]|uniref:Uncharacterized protein n=1 Tax=Schizopora paradoxa TaxID=27342 RepID=A0A0H2S6G7_9AGAM|nr:hypothetical protein SCHPADRAFT_934973 [Schizopora paradoxa]